MIPKIHKQGSNTYGLLNYLYGKGTKEEHVDPHLVAAYDGLSPDPGRDANVSLTALQQILDQPLHLLDDDQRPSRHVWHCSVRAAPGDRVLSDADWADIARRMVAATGIDPGDGAGCRWAAIRHADDHIHMIATLVREDGRRPDHHRSGRRAQDEARRIEADYDLHRVTPGDGTAPKRPTSAEQHKAGRQGRERAAREELRTAVRQALAGATSEDEFFARLHATGLLVRQRAAPSGDLLGYNVALPDDRNQAGEPVYYAGSTLAADLSLPRIRERFTTNPAKAHQYTANHGTDGNRHKPSAAATARRSATHATWAALRIFDQDRDGATAARITATGEILDALAMTSASDTRQQLRDAAWAFERARLSHTRAEHRHAQALRLAARELLYSGPARGRGEDGATAAMLIDTLFFLIVATARWHAQRQHAQQAEAARQAAALLRTAYTATAEVPIARLRERGRQIIQPVNDRYAAQLGVILPDLADTVLAESSWPALVATMSQVQQAGRDPRTLLAEAAKYRELDSASSISEVLVWRLRRMADLPADASTPNRQPGTGQSPTAARPAQPGKPRPRR
ncbi:relaxase/mobilization nuclease domain-containing protein [Streptomyces hyaluromycini]|uniref:Relaxase/mobilization nuclease domain-containing protein n=1 Tax=Streptomyces hyaluromycini TaxID=1377993 RepID=A0ABV1WNH6_9ACTN